jgi:hypothetical protein
MHATLESGKIIFLTGTLVKVEGTKRTALTGAIPAAVVRLVDMKITSEGAYKDTPSIITAMSKGKEGDVFEFEFEHPEQGKKVMYRKTRKELLARANQAVALKSAIEGITEIEVTPLDKFVTRDANGKVTGSGDKKASVTEF